MLRQLVLVLSVAAIIWFAFITVDQPPRRWGMAQIFITFFVACYPAIVFFYALRSTPSSNKPTYLSLFFERRRLEEQAKIDKLKSEAK